MLPPCLAGPVAQVLSTNSSLFYEKLLLSTALVLSAFAAHAQKGSLYIGGQAGFNTSSTETYSNGTKTSTGKNDNYSFSPEIGTFLTNQVQLGIGFTFSKSYQETPLTVGSAAVNKTNRYGGTAYSRYFFGEGNFRLFLGLNASVLSGNGTMQSGGLPNTTTKYNTLDLGANLNAGFAYGLNKRLAVVGSFGTFGFQRSTSKQENTDNGTTTTDFGLNVNTLGNLFTVGVYYTFKQAAEQ
ncbi:MAG: hypothetical protein EOO63_15465 [Hymenobacter sp.]|nr:MAG: hypothetical protein EOO63_15465 [Hymenobacter sp.]